MKQHSIPWYSGIRARVVLLAVIPLLAVTLVIGGYMVHTRLDDARQGLDERGRIIAVNLAMAAELGLLTRDLEQLQRLCWATLQQPDVVWASVRDSNGALLAQSGAPSEREYTQGTYRAAAGTTEIQVDDFADESKPGPPQPLGWAEVQLSLDGTKARQRQIQLTSLLIIGGGLLISLLAARRIGGRISRPLLELSQAMSRYREGKQSVRIMTREEGEIGELARDFNRMAQALEYSQDRLREQVSAATTELHRTIEALSTKNAQLEAAREEAVRAGEEKHEFLARMSHEIRTPLNAVIGFSRLLMSGDADREGIQEYTRTIDRAATQLLTVIDGILNLTKLEAGSLELEHLPFDLRACLEDVVAMLSPAAHEKGLELALVMHHDIPGTLVGDPNRTAQVLVNLLDNAIKFTAVGHVFVEAGYASDDQGRGTVRVTVSDTGVGLSEQERERLFQPFAQADSSITRRYGGTGLGLVISKRLVELMGGTIGVDAQLGKGSRFYFTILCDATSHPIPTPTASPLAGLKVLVYDSEPAQLRALRAPLLGWSMRVFNTVRRERLDAILGTVADKGDPFELLILGLSTNERRPETFDRVMAEIRRVFMGPILVLVGAEHWEFPESALGSGKVDWAVKPLRRSLLHRSLCRLTGRIRNTVDKVPPAQAGRPDFAGHRVLVVEDNAFNRLLLRRLLELRGIEVHEACDGPEAIASARRDGFDLILMDIHMPGMDGVKTARQIRTLAGAGPCPPIVALSADVFSRDQTDTGERVFDGLLLKPISEPALDDAIRRLLHQEGGNGGLAAPEPVVPQCGLAAGVPTFARLPADVGDLLRRETDALCERLQAAVTRDDRDDIRELAHCLKGLFGYFGCRELEAAVGALEAAAIDETAQQLQERVKRLRQRCSKHASATGPDPNRSRC